MYSIDKLSKFPFFENAFNTSSLSDMLDPLTGLLQRAYIVGFVRHLIQKGTPFTFGILDLDNFKFVNDTYGHSAGDGVLKNVASDLIRVLDGKGVAGRFGGDEFLFVNLRDLEYDDKKKFFEGVYTKDRVLRRNVELLSCKPFITGTIGCASFPENAQDYDTLFGMIDKTLYRGKAKGRNCYIIYVEDKHKGLEIQTLAGHGLYSILHSVNEKFELSGKLSEKLSSVYKILREELRVSDLYFVDEARNLRSVMDPKFLEAADDIDKLMVTDMFSSNNLADVEDISPILYKSLRERDIETLLSVRVIIDGTTYGYLLLAEPRSLRIWQDDESAVLYFLSKLIAGHIRLHGDRL